MRIITICICLLICSFANSQALKDTVFFTNGTVVVGKLISVKLGVVTFDPDDANDITVQLRKLRTMSATRKIFRIETVAGEVYFGTIHTHPVTHSIYVWNGSDMITINVEDISVLYAFDKSIAQRFTGTVGIGYTYTRSSGFGRLNFDSKIKYNSRKGELNLTTTGIYTIYDSLFNREKEEVSLKYNYYFIRNWFATAFVSYQRNLELGLERRFQEGVGIGNKFYTSKHVYTWARGGIVVNQERSTENVESGNLAELFGQLEINLFRFEHPKINFLLAETFYYSLSERGRFRNDGAMSVSWEVFKNFYLNLEPYNNYDSKPPGSDSRKLDFGIVFGINYKLNY